MRGHDSGLTAEDRENMLADELREIAADARDFAQEVGALSREVTALRAALTEARQYVADVPTNGAEALLKRIDAALTPLPKSGGAT